MRYSKQRETIYEVVCSTKCHPNAEWVYNEVRKVIPDVSLGTVYRNLNSLVEARRLDSLETALKEVRFDGDMSVHAHFVCDKCCKIYDMAIQAKVHRPDGFNVSHEKHIYYGLCKDCNNAEIK
jgi:Fe2+ or Zn2+ uptake regulation protein